VDMLVPPCSIMHPSIRYAKPWLKGAMFILDGNVRRQII
jgi:hypothetical protein